MKSACVGVLSNTNVDNLRNNFEGGKEGFSSKAALSVRKPPRAVTASILQNVKQNY